MNNYLILLNLLSCLLCAHLLVVESRVQAKGAGDQKYPFTLPPLPYELDSLEPNISKEVLTIHYTKHHQAYVTVLNSLAKDDKTLQGVTLNQLVSTLQPGKAFNAAGQIWNHDFYWHSMSPNGGGKPNGTLAQMIDESFGSFEKFKDQFSQVASGHFGSGWAWLVLTPDHKLKVIDTHDGDNPLNKKDGRGTPLLTCDVWEHAYYLQYKNVRADYVKAFWDLVNWKFAQDNLRARLPHHGDTHSSDGATFHAHTSL